MLHEQTQPLVAVLQHSGEQSFELANIVVKVCQQHAECLSGCTFSKLQQGPAGSQAIEMIGFIADLWLAAQAREYRHPPAETGAETVDCLHSQAVRVCKQVPLQPAILL